MSLTDLTILASEAGEPAVSPYVIGGGVLVFLLFLIVALMSFGGGREHS